MIPLCKYKRYIIMMKSMKLMKSKLNNLLYIPASHACRAILFIAFLLMGNYAIAQTVTTTLPTAYQIAGTSDISIDIYDDVMAAIDGLGQSLTQENYFVRWNVVKDGNNVTINPWGIGENDVRININSNGNAAHVSDNKQYLYYVNSWDSESLNNVLSPTIQFSSGITQLGCKIECWITNDGSKTAADPSNYLVK
jgi:hypothetical protein